MKKHGTIEFNMGSEAPVIVETGKIALLAGGSVTVQQGDTIVLVAACGGNARPGMDFFPLQVSYREKFSAAGRFPGGYFKREGRPTEKEILTSRMTDRPIRSLFPKGYYNEVQVQTLLLSCDGIHEPDTLAMVGASFALALSDLPFNGPMGALRVGRVNGEFVANPTVQQMEESDLELVYAGLVDKTIMIEGEADEISEEDLHKAFVFANEFVKVQVEAQNKLIAECGVAKKEVVLDMPNEDIIAAVSEAITGKIDDACLIIDRAERGAALDAVYANVLESLEAKFDEDRHGELKPVYFMLVEKNIRRQILEEGKRSDGRGTEDLRPLSAEAGYLPRTHGSALFSRGETQALVITTMGSAKNNQYSDGITSGGEKEKSFYLHYNFPNYSVGETGRIMGPGNREVGHGNLAERSVAKMMPDDYPYAVRCVSEVMGSNGSTSMASICGASLSLFDAGIPLKKAVAGISVGLVQEGEQYVMITDILGSEDHYGDMDFKVAGTRDGITGFQLDLKIAGISLDMMLEAMMRDKTARMAILDVMDECISAPREKKSDYAPQMEVVKIDPEKIGALIGPGGKIIKGITEASGAEINIEDDGTVKVFAADGPSMEKALGMIEGETAEVEIGKIYRGVVDGVREFGAFVNILSQTGLLHISEMADYRVENVEDICKVGEKVTVKVLDVDDRGRIKLSRKAALEEMED